MYYQPLFQLTHCPCTSLAKCNRLKIIKHLADPHNYISFLSELLRRLWPFFLIIVTSFDGAAVFFSANCNKDCKEGYKMNTNGVEICECAKPLPVCPSMADCKKQCTYGLKVSRNGCQKCSCNKCPLFSCRKKCVHGYAMNQQGCKLCKCKGRCCKS